MKGIAIIGAVIVLALLGLVLWMNNKGSKSNGQAGVNQYDTAPTSLDKFIQGEDKAASRSCSEVLNIKLLNKHEAQRFDNLMDQKGRACKDALIARSYAKYLDKQGKCWTKAQCEAAKA